jgi:transaldolase
MLWASRPASVSGATKPGEAVKATRLLYELGQSIWLDNITRDLLKSGMLKRYIDELTSNPAIFER